MGSNRQILAYDCVPFDPSDTAVISESKNGSLIGRGVFGHCDKPTQNGRIYSKSLIEREIKKLRKKNLLEQGRFRGELEHPDDANTDLRRVSHYIPDLTVEDNGLVLGELRVMENTRNGSQLQGILDAGCVVGVSSRGLGSTEPVGEGNVKVQDDFDLVAYDVVDDPSVEKALPEFQFESTRSDIESVVKDYAYRREDSQWKGVALPDNSKSQIDSSQQNQDKPERSDTKDKGSPDMDLQTFKNENPDLYESLMEQAKSESDLAEELADNFEQTIQSVQKEAQKQAQPDDSDKKIAEQVKESLLPILKESSNIEESVKQDIEELRAENQNLRQRLDEKSELAERKEKEKTIYEIQSKAATHLSHVLESHREKFLDLLGDPRDYSSVEKFEEKLESVVEDFEDRKVYVEDIQEVVEENIEKRAKIKQKNFALEKAKEELDEKDQLEEDLEEATEIISELKQTVQQKEEGLQEKRDRIKEAIDEIERLESRVKENRKVAKKWKDKAKSNQDKIEDIKSENEALKKDVNRLSKQNEELEIDLERYKEAVGSKSPNADLKATEGARSKQEVQETMERRRNNRQTITENRDPSSPTKHGDEGNIDDFDMSSAISKKIEESGQGKPPSQVTEDQSSNQTNNTSRTSSSSGLMPGKASPDKLQSTIAKVTNS